MQILHTFTGNLLVRVVVAITNFDFWKLNFMTIHFIHIPKTGGQWVRYSCGLVRRGHFEFLENRSEQVTFIRYPLDRWLSAMNHSLTKHNNLKDKPKKYPRYKHTRAVMERVLKEKGKKLYERMIESQMNYNIMVRQLSGIEDTSNIRSHVNNRAEELKKWRAYQPLTTVEKKYTPDEMELFLHRAKENLHKLDFVGHFNNLVLDTIRLSKKFKLPYNPPKRRIGETRKQFVIEDQYIKYVKMLNSYDMRLYKYFVKHVYEPC